MKPTDSVAAFEEAVGAKGSSLVDLLPRTGVERMISFFEAKAAEGCTADSRDMLLFEWGTYNWGEGEFFELSISRQFIEEGAEGEPEISQLRLVFKYAPSPKLTTFGEGNLWCGSRGETREFEKFIQANPAYQAVAEQEAASVRLSHFYV